MYNNEYVQSLLDDYNAVEVNREISPTEAMNDQWYFEMGGYAIEAIILAIRASKIQQDMKGPKITKVLDLPCGHGRVLRHLACLFKDAEIHACDLDKDGVDFCASTFGAIPIHSEEDLTKMDFGCQYDLIWVGSLFTHTSREVTKKWLAHLAKFLSPQGIIVTTVHGRWCEHVHKVAPYTKDDNWNKIIKEYHSIGYGYQDYIQDESHSYIAGSYGISIAKPHISIKDVEEIPDTRIFLYMERAWGDHQDVLVFGRPSYAEPWPEHELPSKDLGCQMPEDVWIDVNRSRCFRDEEAMALVAPFPPSELMANVSGLNSDRDFASHGCDIFEALSKASPIPLTDYMKILDFGCGCGRLSRLFKGHPHEIYGCDIDHRHVKWIQENLPYMKAELTDIHPPLPYHENLFDGIISISIFTHLSEASQDEFLAELFRVSAPEGYLLLTVHGQTALERALNDDAVLKMLNMDAVQFSKAQADFKSGQHAFVLQGGHLTVNKSWKQKLKSLLGKLVIDQPFEYGISFTSEEYIRQHWSKWFEVAAIHPGAIHDFQDIVVLRPKRNSFSDIPSE